MNNEEAFKDITDTLIYKVGELGDVYPNIWYETLIKCKDLFEKTRKYRWHDLMKEKGELLCDGTKYMCLIRRKDKSEVYMTCTYYVDPFGIHYWVPDDVTEQTTVVAWRKIEPKEDDDNEEQN